MLNMFEEFCEEKAIKAYFNLREFLLEYLEGVEIIRTNLLEYSFTFYYLDRKFYISYYTSLEDKDYFILEDIEKEEEVINTLDSNSILDLLESSFLESRNKERR